MRGLKPYFAMRKVLSWVSHLLQMRGLKPGDRTAAPTSRSVASFTDAWIETFCLLNDATSKWSHLLQMRGLKPFRAPRYGITSQSHLLQMRGLKHIWTVSSHTFSWSHLLQMRGLKLGGYVMLRGQHLVASFTDAWIETLCLWDERSKSGCRIFYRCVDWNRKIIKKWGLMYVASFTDAWIETAALPHWGIQMLSRIFYRCVDWNLKQIKWWGLMLRRIFYRCVDWNFVLLM